MRQHLPRGQARHLEQLRRVIAGGWGVADVVAYEDDLTINDRIEAALVRYQAPVVRAVRKPKRIP